MRTMSRYSGAIAHAHSIDPDRANRERDDFYRTPEVAVRRLLAAEPIDGPVWEPACGDGAISEVLRAAGIDVFSTDLVDRGYGHGGVDFFSAARPAALLDLVTNPPFRRVDEFVLRALEITPRKVVILARLLWLEGRRRRAFFASSPLARVWVSSSRLNVSRSGRDYGDGGIGGMVAFAWYVFVRGHAGPPQLGWLPEDGGMGRLF
jgi:hypothetical protein